MQITRNSIDTQKGPADWLTGDVYIDAVAAPAASSTIAAATVHFRAWRAHRLAHPSARPDDLRRRKASGCASAKAGRSRRSAPATASSTCQGRATGMALP
jgi:hypothetical protein